MSWIKTIGYEESQGVLRRIYERVAGPDGYIDNVLQIHSLRPHTLSGHMTLYKNVLHHKANSLPKWYLESLGVYVSHLNQCDYCVQHHLEGLGKLVGQTRANSIWEALESGNLSDRLNDKETAGMQYAQLLTLSALNISNKDIDVMRKAGFDDGEILEVNQVVSYFNYVNRTVMGLGVTTKGDILGLSPNTGQNADDWTHR